MKRSDISSSFFVKKVAPNAEFPSDFFPHFLYLALIYYLRSEFEASDFEVASFINKYRRVGSVSLESLKEQLIEYIGALKDQLYFIINRDYQDFITISTKVRMN